MPRPMGHILTGVGVVAGCFAQAGTIFTAYGQQWLDFLGILLFCTPLSFALYFALFTRWLKPLPRTVAAGAVALSGAYVGTFFALNTYGT